MSATNPSKTKKKLIAGVALGVPVIALMVGWMMWRSTPTQQGNSGSERTVASQPGAQEGQEGKSPTSPSSNSPTSSSTLPTGSLPAGSSGNTTTQGQIASSTTAPANSVATSEKIDKPILPVDTCFTLKFRHKPMPTHGTEDECSHHRNLIKLSRNDLSPGSACIRVNGNPVRHEAVSGKTDEFVIGAVAGPKDVITARFCVGKAKCKETCAYPAKELVKKDEFLEAIGGSAEDDTKEAQLGQWEAKDGEKSAEVNKALDSEIRKELEGEQVGARAPAALAKLDVFREWISDSTEQPACGGDSPSRVAAAGR